MKRIFLLAFFLLWTATAPAQTNNFNRTRTYDVQHYTIRVQFNRSAQTITGDTTIELRPLKGNFKKVELDAAGMKFDSVRLQGSAGKNLSFRQAGEKLIIELDKAYSPKDLLAIRFVYSCKPQKGVYFVNESRRGRDIRHSAQIWTQGEPEEAHHWFPSYDFPDDKATTEQFLTVDADETAIANGELMETKQNSNGTKTFHYKMNIPHSTYLTSFVIGKYTRINDKYKDIPLGYYVYPGYESIVPKAYGRTKDMFRVFEQLTQIDYPFNKYDQTMVANFTFGGMENITATTMADTEILAANFIPGAVEDLVAHELAHSWFGNLVTCRNWAELWLNEGLATFMEAAYRENAYGRSDYLRKVMEDASRAMADDAVNRKPHALYNQTAGNVSTLFDNPAITYNKGGAVIHTLREEVGDQNFWRALNLYLNRHKFANVETPDLKKAMEEVAGRDLDWFFDQWVYKIGYPRLEVKQVYQQKNRKLILTVNQVQKAVPQAPAAFILPLDIEIQTEAGTKTESIRIEKRSQEFTFEVDSAPVTIEFDKNHKIPLKAVKIQPPVMALK